MSAIVFKPPNLAQPAATALVVEPVLTSLLAILSTLASLGFDVLVAESFKDAKGALRAARPSLLVTDIRLHEYNGLHLVLRGQTMWPGLPALVTSPTDDPVLRAEAARLDSTFVTLPVSPVELHAAICRTVFRSSAAPRDPIRPPFERRHSERRSPSGPSSIAGKRRVAERRRPTLVHTA